MSRLSRTLYACPNLKFLNLSYSKVSYLNLGRTPHLEGLYLENCSYLQEIHASVGCLRNLVNFRLDHGLNFASFDFNKEHKSANLDSVVTCNIRVDCVDMRPVHPNNNLRRFRFTCEYDEPISSWSGNFEKLISFGPCVCENLEYILETICGLQHLRELKLEGSIPGDLWRLESLEKLSLKELPFHHFPDSICMLKHLKSLQLNSSFALELLPENICRLECLEDLTIWCCAFLREILNSICKLKYLKRLRLTYCYDIKKLPEELGSLECLKELNIEGSGIRCLPQSIYQLKGLHILGRECSFSPMVIHPQNNSIRTSTGYSCE